MAINGNEFREYVKKEMKRMGFDNADEMVYVDQLWRHKFGSPLPNDYNHANDFHLLEADMPKIPQGGLVLII